MLRLAVAAVLVTATPALASDEWTSLGTTRNNTEISIRTADMLRGRSHQTAARMWLRLDARRDRTVAWREMRILYAVNCPAESVSRVTTHVVDADGDTDSWSETRPKVEFAVPGTFLATAVEWLCTDPSRDGV